MLLAIDLHEDFIDVEGITVASVLSLQSSGVKGPELNAPEPDRFAAYSDASFSQEIFYISVAEIESIRKPDCVTDDVRRESVSLIGIHGPILPISAS